MRVIDASWEIVPQKGPLCEQIERAGRMAYKSEDKITPGSAEKFVTTICTQGHMPVLEFAVVHVVIAGPSRHMNNFVQSRGWNATKYVQMDVLVAGGSDGNATILLSGSVRALSDYLSGDFRRSDLMSMALGHWLFLLDSVAFFSLGYRGYDEDFTLFDFKKITDDELPNGFRLDHQYILVKFITNRAVTHEIVRHRPCSFLQESQRYCRYDLKKFGHEVTFINPRKAFNIFKNELCYTRWRQSCEYTEKQYLALLADDVSPQAARTVLPNSCKTEILVFANLKEWQHIFNMRVPKSAEPSMRELTVPLQKEMCHRFPELQKVYC